MTTATKQEKYSSSFPPLSPLDGGPNTRVEGGKEGAIVIVELHNNTFLRRSLALLPFLFIIFLGPGSHTE